MTCLFLWAGFLFCYKDAVSVIGIGDNEVPQYYMVHN